MKVKLLKQHCQTIIIISRLSYKTNWHKIKKSCVFPNVNKQTTTSIVLYKYRIVAELLWNGFQRVED